MLQAISNCCVLMGVLTVGIAIGAEPPDYVGQPPEPAHATTSAPTQSILVPAPPPAGIGSAGGIDYEGQPPEPPVDLPALPSLPAVAGAAVAKTDPESKAGEPFSPLEEAKVYDATEGIESPRAWFDLVGIDQSQFRGLEDGWPLSEGEEEILLKVIYQVRRFDKVLMAEWTRKDWSYDEVAADPEQHRLEMLFVPVAQATKITIHTPPAEVVRRYELPRYYAISLKCGEDEWPALLITPTIPELWDPEGPLDERVSVQGLFLKTGVTIGGRQRLVLVAQRPAWHPSRVDEDRGVNMGMTLLGEYGMDVGQLSLIQNRKAITSRDREAFYQMLWAVEQMDARSLDRLAGYHLDQLENRWQHQQEQLQQEALQLSDAAAERTSEQQQAAEQQLQQNARRRALLSRSIEAAGEGTFSVFPLFNLAEEQHGRLVMLEGEARRAIEIKVAGAGGHADSNRDIVQRFGIESYYEVEIFTKDSQNNPIVFCVHRLPEEFPVGEDIREHVRIPGFFFKTWAYHTREGPGEDAGSGRGNRQQLAPLLIGPELIWVQPEEKAGNSLLGLISGGLFVLALLAICTWVWLYRRSDDEFHKKAIAKRYEVEGNQSLEDLDLQAEDGPDFSHLG